MTKIVLGSNNHGKLLEFKQMLEPLGFEVLTPLDLSITTDVEERGESFDEIALNKARDWAKLTKLPTLVDDSGLVIDALGGKPGIYSKRFVPGSDLDRNNEVLTQMKNVSEEKRTAHFYCALAFYDPGKNIQHVEIGQCFGTIAQEMTGNGGFGYDPIFIPRGYKESFGVLGADIKNTLSHRYLALAKMVLYLKQY